VSDPCYLVISDLEKHSSRLNKEQIIEAQARFGNGEFFAGCRLALDSMVTFGLKQIPEKKDEDGPGLDWSDFISLAVDLRDRNLTGNDARDAVAQALTQATKNQWNGWYRRILIKDLRCGVSEKTINKVVSKINESYSIPVFSCQLAHDSANHEAKLTGKKQVEVKLDGVRVIAVVHPSGNVNLFSRNGKQLDNFPHVAAQLALTASAMKEPWVLDGEIMSSSFQDLMTQVHRKSNVQSDDAVLHLFDWLPLANFEQGGWDKSQKERSKALKLWHGFYADKLPNVQVVGYEEVDLKTDAGRTRAKEINAAAVAGGYEGIMYKDVAAPYECKRTASWLKLKPFIEVSLEIIGFEEGTGKNVGRLGAFICSGIDDGRQITVNVGSGFSDDQRVAFWESRNDLLGDIVEIRADAITKNQDGTYSLRFPRFLHFRGMEHGEKI
jgi:DNA ligase-1